MLGAALGDASTAASNYASATGAATQLLWPKYFVPADCRAWLCALSLVCQQLQVGVTISDATLPGNPLIYVNAEFTRLTGYAAADALGRNCRFLQGKKSEPAAVVAMQAALRKGRPSYCAVNNYRADGEAFRNMVSLRPVHDSFGVLRYCIGVQADAVALCVKPEALASFAYALQLMPTTVAVASRPAGLVQKPPSLAQKASSSGATDGGAPGGGTSAAGGGSFATVLGKLHAVLEPVARVASYSRDAMPRDAARAKLTPRSRDASPSSSEADGSMGGSQEDIFRDPANSSTRDASVGAAAKKLPPAAGSSSGQPVLRGDTAVRPPLPLSRSRG